MVYIKIFVGALYFQHDFYSPQPVKCKPILPLILNISITVLIVAIMLKQILTIISKLSLSIVSNPDRQHYCFSRLDVFESMKSDLLFTGNYVIELTNDNYLGVEFELNWFWGGIFLCLSEYSTSLCFGTEPFSLF